jgi:hypothetical protein
MWVRAGIAIRRISTTSDGRYTSRRAVRTESYVPPPPMADAVVARCRPRNKAKL